MTTLKEMAEKYASDSGWCRDMSPYNFDICVKVYLAGATAALEMAQEILPPTAQRFSGFDTRQRIRNLIPE